MRMENGNIIATVIVTGNKMVDELRTKFQSKILMKFSVFDHGYEPSSKYIGH